MLQSIQNLECSLEFGRLSFEPSSYRAASGKENPEYLITRDGFSFLAMGFTGKDAATWKERYINAFNEMEAKLKEKQAPAAA